MLFKSSSRRAISLRGRVSSSLILWRFLQRIPKYGGMRYRCTDKYVGGGEEGGGGGGRSSHPSSDVSYCSWNWFGNSRVDSIWTNDTLWCVSLRTNRSYVCLSNAHVFCEISMKFIFENVDYFINFFLMQYKGNLKKI